MRRTLNSESAYPDSADGSTLATGGADGTVRVWDFSKALESLTARSEPSSIVEALHVFQTKNATPVVHVRWTQRNLLLAGGAFEKN